MHEQNKALYVVDSTVAEVTPWLVDAWNGGPAILPIDAGLPTPLRSQIIAAVRPTAIVREESVVTLPGGIPVSDDTVVVLPTSGSTGTPKFAELTRSGLESSVTAGLQMVNADPDIPWLACLPVNHVGGLLVLLRGIVTGTSVIDTNGFDPAAIAEIDTPYHLAVVPTMLRRLIDAGVPKEQWRTVLVGGAAVSDGLRSAVPAMTRTYGMTETSGGCVYDGVPFPGVVVDTVRDEHDNEVLRIGGPTLMAGYRQTGTTQRSGLDDDGRFITSDLGTVTDGAVSVTGRADDVIVTGGEKVFAPDVAARLREHPEIVDAAVVGRPDPEWGQAVVAVVVPLSLVSLNEQRAWVAETLPKYAAPVDIVVVKTLPTLPNGKLDRAALQRAAAGRPDQ